MEIVGGGGGTGQALNRRASGFGNISDQPKLRRGLFGGLVGAAEEAEELLFDLLGPALSIGPGGGTPAEASAFVKEETLRWGDVIRKAGIEPE